ncbi:hypothetical protein G7076_05150 [Sphingomonas sp. HDW15A]|uniref:hypothetical protein n=1 Tax=Sphingomonas sp. HDW15A TaxID=2714942 RepID=UPI0014087291|nr:hypothetical protein [Sphingomonas sp. HDW15A]QIK95937.1 hypothetical protein G7076_05150 [Sphingomonas sp. HDW15A]
MGPGEAIGLFIAIGFPSLFLIYLTRRWFALKERRLEIDALAAAEKAAQYTASNKELEARVRVLEKIVTDGGAQTAAQIEALREPRRIEGDKVQ